MTDQMTQKLIVKKMDYNTGDTLSVGGIIDHDAKEFELCIGSDEFNIVLKIHIHFGHCDKCQNDTVEFNSYLYGTLGEPVKVEGRPFKRGAGFKIQIELIPGFFKITMTAGSVYKFPNRMEQSKYSVFKMKGDAIVTSLE